jgi:hypothetical protein
MERKLWVLRRHGGRIVLGSPVVAVVVADGELRSEAEGAQGAALADGCSTASHLVLRDECLLRLFTKPSRDGALSVLGKVAPGCGGSWRRSMQVTKASTGFRGLFVISIFSRSLCANRFRQLSSIS